MSCYNLSAGSGERNVSELVEQRVGEVILASDNENGSWSDHFLGLMVVMCKDLVMPDPLDHQNYPIMEVMKRTVANVASGNWYKSNDRSKNQSYTNGANGG